MALARVFLAVAPDEALRAKLGTLTPDPSPANGSGERNTPAERIAALHERVQALAPGLAPFAFELHGPELFPDARHPRVIALLPALTGALRGTARELVLFESKGGHYHPLFRVAAGEGRAA